MRKLREVSRNKRNQVMSLISAVLSISTYFLVMRFIVQSEGLESVGLWSLTIGFVSFVRLMDVSGASSLARMVAMRADSPEAQASYVNTMSLFITGFYVAVCLIAYWPLVHFLQQTVSYEQWGLTQTLILWALISLPINVLGIAHLSAIDGVGRADIRSVINIFGAIVFVVFAMLTVKSIGLLGLAFAQFIRFLTTFIIARVVLLAHLPGLGLLPSKYSREAAKSCLGYGLKYQAASLPMAIFDPLTRILIGRWIGLEYLGVYDLSYKLAVNTRTLIQSYLNPLFPEFTRQWSQGAEAAREYYSDQNLKSMHAVSAGFCAIILLSPAASFFLFSEISGLFIFSTAILSLGWGLASLTLPTQLFGKAAGTLRWSICGQLSILFIAPVLLFGTVQTAEHIWIVGSVAATIIIGHAVEYAGITKVLGLKPVNHSNVRSRLVALALSVAFITLALMAAGWGLANL